MEKVRRIAQSEWVLMTVMKLLASCRDGVGNVVGRDPHIANFGVIVPLPLQLVELIDQLNFFQVVRASDFDVQRSYLEYCRTKEVYWSLRTIASLPYYCFQREWAELVALVACSVPTRNRTASGNI